MISRPCGTHCLSSKPQNLHTVHQHASLVYITLIFSLQSLSSTPRVVSLPPHTIQCARLFRVACPGIHARCACQIAAQLLCPVTTKPSLSRHSEDLQAQPLSINPLVPREVPVLQLCKTCVVWVCVKIHSCDSGCCVLTANMPHPISHPFLVLLYAHIPGGSVHYDKL